MTICGDYIRKYLCIPKVTKYNNLDCITFKCGKNTHRILFAGGAKQNSQDSIQGLTIQNIYLTEANLLHQSFITQCMNRIANSDNPKIFFTINPLSEQHWFYTQFLDKWETIHNDEPEMMMYNYKHVTILDNPSMTQAKYDAFVQGIDPNSLTYKRNVLGLRVNAGGTVYTLTDENIINNIDNIYSEYIIVVDTGVTISATTMLALGLCYNTDTKQKELHVLREYYHLNGGNIDAKFKSDDDYAKDIAKFTHDMKDAIKKVPTRLYYDGTTVMKTKIQRELRSLQLGNINPMFVIKDALKDRLVDSQNMIYSNQIKILDTCKHLIQEIKTAEYDDKEFDKSGEVKIKKAYNTEGHLDCIDVLQYGISYYTKNKKV